MKATLLSRSVVLIVTIALGGCVPVASFHEGARSSALEKGKTTRADVLEMFNHPEAKTRDGRFFLYAYHKETWWLDLINGSEAYKYDGRLLIEFDETNIVKEYAKHKCKTTFKISFLSGEPLCLSLCEMLKKRVEADVASRYCQALVAAASLTESLYEAARLGDLEEVRRLIAQDADVDAQARDGRTPLIVAIAQGNPVVVELLIANGAGINSKSKSGRTPLIVAIAQGNPVVVELLIAKSADVNGKDLTGGTPLHWAARLGETVMVQLLLANGAGANAKDALGRTPLYYALEYAHDEVAELLKQHGAKE